MKDLYKIEECRSCSSKKLIPIISLGDQYVVNFLDSDKNEGIKCPLNLILCNDCKLLQLEHNAPPESMWNDQYWYKSGINKMIKDNLEEIVLEAEKTVKLKKGDIILDIGCNDGTLFEYYATKGLIKYGFEPSKNVAREAKEKGFEVANDFFGSEKFKEKFGNKKAKVITAISMFYDLENPNKFVGDIVKILDNEGIFVVQQNYLASMLEQNAFDNICHEHREYYSLTSLKPLLEKYGLEIFKTSLNEINGGSIRTLIKFKDSKIPEINEKDFSYLRDLEIKEKEMKLTEEKPYKDFAGRINSIKKDLLKFLEEEKSKGKNICALGASTRGNVLLQYFEIGPDLIKCIFDKNPDKEGKRTVGSLIPITSPDNILKYNPDYQLVLIWHIFKGIGKDEKKFVDEGGKFIMPLPKFKVLDKIE